MKLATKVIVITGATRGIGRAIAEACAEEGGKIVICSRNKEAVDKTCSTMAQKGADITGIAADVSQPGDVKKVFDHALTTYKTIDVWINNAGLSGGYRYLHHLGEDEIGDIVDVNITSVLQACRIVIPYFIENKKGIIINMSGKGGRCDASPYMTVYAATKAAVTSLTKSLAKEYKKYPLSIHSVIHGMVATDFYNDLKVSPDLAESMKAMPAVLKAFGVPKEKIGKGIVDICTQEPGKKSGNQYFLAGKTKMMKGGFTMMWYRITGKV